MEPDSSHVWLTLCTCLTPTCLPLKMKQKKITLILQITNVHTQGYNRVNREGKGEPIKTQTLFKENTCISKLENWISLSHTFRHGWHFVMNRKYNFPFRAQISTSRNKSKKQSFVYHKFGYYMITNAIWC